MKPTLAGKLEFGSGVQNLRKTRRRIRSQKPRVFERTQRIEKLGAKNGLKVSQNSFLISASQKVRVRLSFERTYDNQTDKDRSHSRAGEAATSS
jgi:hypothetical protein